MTGGPDLRLASADGALPGRPAGGKLARSGAQPAAAFDALLARMGPKAGAKTEPGGEARQVGKPVGADLRRPAVASPDARKIESDRAETVAVDPAQQGQSLAQGVAERIAATLQGGQATSTPAGPAIDADASADADAVARREAALTASIAVAASLARRADGVGSASGRVAAPALAVTHRETVFAAATLAGIATQAAAGRDGAAGAQAVGATAAMAETVESGPAAEPGPIPHGRAEQPMPGDRTAGARGAAPARIPEGHAGAAEPRAGGELRQPAGETAQKPAIDGPALGLPGAADQRPSAAAPSATASASQAAAAPPTFSVVPGAVKVLHIQLHPAELGVLEVKMRMTDAGLEVHIEASRQETVALLKSDRDTLESVLRGAGHALDAVTVSLAEKGGGASGQPSQDGSQSQASGARPEAQAGSPREQAREQGGRFDDRSPSRPDGHANEKVHDDQNQPAAAVRPRGALYL